MGSGISSDNDSCVEKSSADLSDNNLIDSATTDYAVNHMLIVLSFVCAIRLQLD